MPHCPPTNERLCHLRHADGTLHPCRHSQFLQGILKGQGVDDRRQHSHIIAGGPLNTPFAPLQTPKDIPTTHHNHQFHPKQPNLLNLLRDVVNGLRTNADPGLTSKSLAAEFDQYATIFCLFCRCSLLHGKQGFRG